MSEALILPTALGSSGRKVFREDRMEDEADGRRSTWRQRHQLAVTVLPPPAVVLCQSAWPSCKGFERVVRLRKPEAVPSAGKVVSQSSPFLTSLGGRTWASLT